jgi:hypothetical protein
MNLYRITEVGFYYHFSKFIDDFSSGPIVYCTKYANLLLILPDVYKNVRFPTTDNVVPS